MCFIHRARVERSTGTPTKPKICICRYSVEYQPYLATAIWLTSAVETMPPSINRGGAGAWTIPSSQDLQTYFGRIVRTTRSTAGMRSSTSLSSSPIRCSLPAQQPQIVVSGSMVTSTRGKSLGRAPMLRLGFFRAACDSGFAEPAVSSFAATGLVPVARSPNSSASCSARTTCIRSDRAPKISLCSRSTVASNTSFLAAKASVNSVNKAGSLGRSSGRSAIPQSTRRFAKPPVKCEDSRCYERSFNDFRNDTNPLG